MYICINKNTICLEDLVVAFIIIHINSGMFFVFHTVVVTFLLYLYANFMFSCDILAKLLLMIILNVYLSYSINCFL